MLYQTHLPIWIVQLIASFSLLAAGTAFGIFIARRNRKSHQTKSESVNHAASSVVPPLGAFPPASLLPLQIRHALESAYQSTKHINEGKNTDYIPYLAKVPPHLFGLALVTTDGQMYAAGDSEYSFAIESISKVFTLCVVMQDIGPDEVRRKLGANPTGQPFDSILTLELQDGRTLNPFVNAGALATTSLVSGRTPAERWEKILRMMDHFAGRKLALHEEVYQSESMTNQRNRGIAWLMESYGYMYSDPIITTELYTRQCSVAVTTCDLAMMGATLANGGIHPTTRDRIIEAEYIPHVLVQMTMNGLYNSTGDWLYTVGLPGKSGVSGGILAVVPGLCGIAAFSPPVDSFGNSVRGQRAVQHIAVSLKLNMFAARATPFKQADDAEKEPQTIQAGRSG